jgi:phosphoribosylformylglycinamidine synthase
MQADYAAYLEPAPKSLRRRLAEKPVCLMDLATLAMKELRRRDVLTTWTSRRKSTPAASASPSRLTGMTEDYLVMFKNETHNHPTEIEPFRRRGHLPGRRHPRPAFRRSYVYQAMRVTGSGDPTVPVSETLPGKLPQRKITTTPRPATVPTATRSVWPPARSTNSTTPAISPNAWRSARSSALHRQSMCARSAGPGDQVILLGGRTGRDGCGGATGSSKAHDELAISESQERMAVVIAVEDKERFIALAHEENLEAVVVAEVTKSPRLVMHWRGDTIVNLSREFLNTNGVTQKAKAKIQAVDAGNCYRTATPAKLLNMSKAKALKANLARLEVCSQKGLAERFDASIGAGTVLMPFAGQTQLTPEDAMCAKIPLESGETDDATAMSYGFIPGMSRWSPFHGAVYAVTEALAKLAAIGADPLTARLTLQEYFERLRDMPERWGKPASALLGALTAQLNFGVPAIGGKDSMSGSFNELDVPPTLVCFAVAMTKACKTGSAAFKKAGSRVVLLNLPTNKETLLPEWEGAKNLLTRVSTMVQDGVFSSASAVREGGAAAAVCRMAFGNSFGFEFAAELDEKVLFAPLCGSFVAELAEDTTLEGIDFIDLGRTSANQAFVIDGEEVALSELAAAWSGTLENVFPTRAKTPDMPFDVPLYGKRYGKAPAIKAAVPRVIIPVFPGTNCEVDTARAFKKAGATPEILIMKNLSPRDIDESVSAFIKSIKNSQIIMLPGGFSGGDEPDGSGKFIATTLRNERVRDAVQELLEKRDGLMLGICNGFQALIKTGLVPFGRIVDIEPEFPTLTFNTLGRHVSQMAYTRITSVMSPWMSLVEAGDIHAVPVSHGEGRFAADEKTIEQLIANGQIATQYVDLFGKPCAGTPFNPNGSVCAVEGITSPDGRILGKMAHSERKGENLYKNVPFNKDQKIFESGVLYFT